MLCTLLHVACFRAARKKGRLVRKLYSAIAVAQKIGTPYRTLMEWVAKGIVRPALYTPGKRTTFFSQENVREILILRALREHLSLQQIRSALDDLRQIGHNPLSTGDFIVARNVRGERLMLKICNEDQIIELLRQRPQMIELFRLPEIEAIITGIEPNQVLEEVPPAHDSELQAGV